MKTYPMLILITTQNSVYCFIDEFSTFLLVFVYIYFKLRLVSKPCKNES